jgi:hypothetical protein
MREATFEVYKYLNLVPTPDDSDEESASVISWDTRHALAREALLNLSLPTLSKLSLSRTVRRRSGNVLKTNMANLLTLNTFESIQNLKPSSNLYFLQSLGKDWEIWGMAKGKLIRTLQPTAELMAAVRALAMRGNTASQAETAALE